MLGPSLHAIEFHARGFNEQYVKALVDTAKHLSAKRVPVVFTVMHLATLSKTSWSALMQTIVRQSENDYRVFSIRKKSGGFRRICVPAPHLMQTQRWIHDHILNSRGALDCLHGASTAYGKGSSILNNASAHAGSKWLIKIDIKDFFESISERQIYYVFRRFGYKALLAFELTRICTRAIPPRYDGRPRRRDKTWRWSNSQVVGKGPYLATATVGHLPQGAPTSAMLANYAVASLDEKIQAIADGVGATYTRYADDIVLSMTNSSRELCQTIFRQVCVEITTSGFRLNEKKCFVRGPGDRKIVTGLMVNDVKPRLTKSIKDEIEVSLHCIGKFGLLSHIKRKKIKSPLGYLNHLNGLIRFAYSIDDRFGNWATKELDRVLAPERETIELLKNFSGRPRPNRHMFG
ncbi:reverse transcriptase family protein [Burkholderia cenocepacia]|uniref:RNA-directed DNA polymerase n=1 Tax=Burkholderia cenocepacia TaxID=95486 RepID=A0A3Q9FEP0_9BURK|nr:reverse transcriptase family protein [Burkholderia cenocepacia]AZQ55976.1 RNA-directed DNA polymerase [Burkholderia cenocepacia]